jgi:sugar/nucleoside kinase (ribokinase family)
VAPKLISLAENDRYKYRSVIGVGGIGSGVVFALEGNSDLRRNESRPARLLDARDYCKLHIITHYLAVLLEAGGSDDSLHLVPVGKVGADSSGARLIEEMTTVGIDTTYVDTVSDYPTMFSVCYQYPDGSGGNITTTTSAASLLATVDVDRVESLFEHTRNQSVALAVPEAPLHVRHHLLKLATKYGALRVASFTSTEVFESPRTEMFGCVDLLFLNQDEAVALVGQAFDPSAPQPFLERCSDTLTALQPQIDVVMTAGKNGAFGFTKGEWIHSAAPAIDVVSTAGAGDALLACTLAGLMVGLPLTRRSHTQGEISSALDFGVLFASYSTTSPHTIHPLAQLDAVLEFAKHAGVKFEQSLTASLVGDETLA